MAWLRNSDVATSATLNNNSAAYPFGDTIETDLTCSGNGTVDTFGTPNIVGGIDTCVDRGGV